MNISLSKKLKERLIHEGYTEIAEALDCKQSNSLSREQKDILIKFSNLVKNSESVVKENFGIAGPSPSSGGSGFISGIRD